MRNIILVIKQEITTTLKKRSFWITAFLFPLFILGINIGVPLLLSQSMENSSTPTSSITNSGSSTVIGFVDYAGLIQELPSDIPSGLLKPFPSDAEAQDAMADEVINEYVIIPADYLQTGRLIVVQHDFNPLGTTPEKLFKYIIDRNLTGNEALAAAINQPAEYLERHPLAPGDTNNGTSSLTILVPMAVLFIFFFLLILSSGFMLQSVSREKENRTVEILLLSLRPRELMLGKILGLSIVALLQITIWIGGGLIVLGRGREMLRGAATYQLPPGFLVWTLLYFGLGFLLYASLMGAIGAVAPSAREGGQFTFLILLPLMIPLWFNSLFIQSPNSPLALALSLFPLTAPASMITRLVVTNVPLWQTTAGLTGLAVTVYVVILLSSRFFQAKTLLSHTAINWQRIFAVLQTSQTEKR